MIIRPTDIHEDTDKARLGFVQAAKELGVEFNCHLTTMWKIDLTPAEVAVFLELARESCR